MYKVEYPRGVTPTENMSIYLLN